MTIPAKLQTYLRDHQARWDVVEHGRTATSAQTVRVAGIPAQCLAKSVLLADDDGYLVVVLPAGSRVHLGNRHRQLNRQVRLATEADAGRLFDDCEPGAIPALGQAYGVPTIVDDALMAQPEIYFEAGDHTELIHMSGSQFSDLMAGARHGHFVVDRRDS